MDVGQYSRYPEGGACKCSVAFSLYIDIFF